MISSEVERTLVKSPPELWAELSDPAALSRHLGELGEISIVRTEPENTVEWAAKNTTGTVSIQPSGWGTKVTLSVTRELDGPAPTPESPSDVSPAIEPESTETTEPEPTAAPEPESTAAPEPEPSAAAESEPIAATEPEPTAAAEPESEAAPEREIEREPRRGFFARLFTRRLPASVPPAPLEDVVPPAPIEAAAAPAPIEATVQPEPTAAPEPEPIEQVAPAEPDAFAAVRAALAPETFAATHLFATQPGLDAASAPERETRIGAAGDISAELMAAEEVAAEEVTAVLTAVLDRLGAAHHRPFSRT